MVEEVNSTSIENIFSRFELSKIDFLKVDIEGAEYDFLMGKDLSKVRFLAIEAPVKREKSLDLINYICNKGFIKIFDNGKDFTFANKKENVSEIHFVDFATIYFSKMKNEFPFSVVEKNCYRKNKITNRNKNIFPELKKRIKRLFQN